MDTTQNTIPPRLQEAANEITKKLLRLFQIYQSDFLTDIPVDLCQYSHFNSLLMKCLSSISSDPIRFMTLQQDFYTKFTVLYSQITNKLVVTPNLSAPPTNVDDPRFKDPDWSNIAWFDFIKKVYLLCSEHLSLVIKNIPGLDEKAYAQVEMYSKNFIDAIAPSNYILSNPELIRATMESSGENLFFGFKHYLQDLIDNKGHFNIRMTKTKNFIVGDNLANTPGKIIYQNELMQLIQYTPVTATTYAQPILFIPPWINKYYILDLCPEKSMVKWLLEQSFTVFMISWKNPGAELAEQKFEDYMLKGPLQAIEVITATLAIPKLHLVGYCIGGTLLGCTLAYMQAKGDNRAATGTYLTTLLDFSNPGELGIFIDEIQINALEKVMQEKGYLNGKMLDAAFNMISVYSGRNERLFQYEVEH